MPRLLPSLAWKILLFVGLAGCSPDQPPLPPESPPPERPQQAPAVPSPRELPPSVIPIPRAVPPPSTDSATLERQALGVVRRSTLTEFPLWLQEQLPPGARVDRLTEIQVSGASADRIHYRLLGYAPGPEPFSALLRTQTDIHDIEVHAVQAKASESNVLVQFTIQLDPSH